MIFIGDKAYSSEAKKTTYLTGHALALKVKDKDTIYIHADSLILKKDSLNKTDIINGYAHVRIFQKSIQASCDSAIYEPKNNKLFLRSKPMVWSQNAELKGILMEISLKDSLVERIDITGNASALMELDSGKYYNQIAGREMIAFMKNNQLVRSDVKGNAWTIFYPEDEEKTDSLVTKKRMGMNRLFASDLRIYLDSGEVSGVTYFDKPDGIFYPMDQIKTEELFIKGFEWNPMLRPKDPIKMMERN
jgi:lipopolysaccharide export system protein LptA